MGGFHDQRSKKRTPTDGHGRAHTYTPYTPCLLPRPRSPSLDGCRPLTVGAPTRAVHNDGNLRCLSFAISRFGAGAFGTSFFGDPRRTCAVVRRRSRGVLVGDVADEPTFVFCGDLAARAVDSSVLARCVVFGMADGAFRSGGGGVVRGRRCTRSATHVGHRAPGPTARIRAHPAAQRRPAPPNGAQRRCSNWERETHKRIIGHGVRAHAIHPR